MLVASLLFTASTLLFREVFAQSVSTGASCIDSFSWASNSLKQNPCLVAAYLLSPCSPDGSYVVPPLDENTHYLGPDTLALSNNCQCNTVTYSMLSACGLCQNRTAINWSSYSYQCKEVESNEYPYTIPEDTAVPGWAYINLNQDAFDVTEAQNVANTTSEHKPPPPPAPAPSSSTTTSSHSTSRPRSSGSTHSHSATSSSSAASQSPQTSDSAKDEASPPSSQGSRTDKIIGGVLGGILGLALVIALTFIALKQRRRANTGLQSLSSSTANVSEQPETKSISTAPVTSTSAV